MIFAHWLKKGMINLSEYKDISNLKKDLSALVDNKLIDSNFRQAISGVIMTLERCPKITVCSNCQYLREDDSNNGKTYMYCSLNRLSITPNDFCSLAERE